MSDSIEPVTCAPLAHVREVAPTSHGCAECSAGKEKWVQLRRCRTCGHVGGCDSSKNQHATKHFEATGHPIIKSLEIGEDWGAGAAPCSRFGPLVEMDADQSRYAFQSFGAQFAEVRVDEDLGLVRVSRFTSVQDIGRVINEKTARSQVYSGVIKQVSKNFAVCRAAARPQEGRTDTLYFGRVSAIKTAHNFFQALTKLDSPVHADLRR